MRVPTNRWFTLPLILASAAVLVQGIYAFTIINTGRAVSAGELKFAAERILFFAICEFAFILAVWSTLVYRGVRIEKRLDRLIDQSRYRRLRKDVDFRHLGQLGPRLKDLYSGLTDTNEKLGIKVSSQGALLDLIVSSSSHALLVTSSTGIIIYISKTLLTVLEKEKHQVTGRVVTEIWDSVNVQELTRKFETDYDPVVLELKNYPLTVYPVMGTSGVAAYLVFNTEKRPLFYNPGNRETVQKKPSFARDLSRLFSRRRSAKQENNK